MLGTLLFHQILNFMIGNIEDFETVPLPPKIPKKFIADNPLLKIDATSKDMWTLVDFATGETHQVKEPEEQLKDLKNINWDLGFQRTKIISNGGDLSTGGQVGVVNLGQVDINSVETAPDSGYLQMTRSFGKLSNDALSDWYTYRTRTHNIESHKNVYVVKTHAGEFMKFRILNYYCRNQEKDCRTTVCGRDEAACLTVEYAFQSKDTGRFPKPKPPVTVSQTAVTTP